MCSHGTIPVSTGHCGLQMINRQNGGVYSEVDGFSTLLKYKTANAGCCKVSMQEFARCIFKHASYSNNSTPSLLCIALKGNARSQSQLQAFLSARSYEVCPILSRNEKLDQRALSVQGSILRHNGS